MDIGTYAHQILKEFKYLDYMIQHAKHKPETLLRNIIVLLTVIVISVSYTYGQTDTVKHFKNTIKYNITNPMLFGSKFNVVGYERVIKEHQTASISFGRIDFPRLIEMDFVDSLGIQEQQNDKGFNISLDYRFYVRKENKYGAPRGVYLGPYYAFNSFSRDLSWDMNTTSFSGTVKTNIKLTGNFIGAQMGYQFILWNRMTIDMILFGPGKWFFNMKTNFDTSLSEEDETLLLEKLNEKFKEKFPGSDFVFKGGGFEAKKSTNTSATGLRYMVNIGFRF
jgi:hypothetical protein